MKHVFTFTLLLLPIIGNVNPIISPPQKEYESCNDIYQADSVVAVAMLLNRECPECSFEEKVYMASCVTYGTSFFNVDWKTYVFKKNQFWNLTDPRIKFDKDKNEDNLKASLQAWNDPKPVIFYASDKYDKKTKHLKQVKRNSVWKGFHYYSNTLK